MGRDEGEGYAMRRDLFIIITSVSRLLCVLDSSAGDPGSWAGMRERGMR